MLDNKITVKASEYMHLEYIFWDYRRDTGIQLQHYNKRNVSIKRNFSEEMLLETQIRIHNHRKRSLNYGEIWHLKTGTPKDWKHKKWYFYYLCWVT